MHKKQPKMTGFTLIELMITLVVAVILLSIAAPSFVDIIKNNRLTTQINELSASLNLSRSEAIKRSITITVCKSNDQASCSGNWHDGWIVFEDANDNGTVDSGETIIRVHPAITSGNTLTSSKNRITYNSNGFAIGYNSIFRLCDDRGASSVKGLVISNSGRIRVAKSAELTSCS
jgi:type IV fimbrial biogenesis protein FimT